MAIYAVYARAPRSTLWSLRELFPTKDEADRSASAAVDVSAGAEGAVAASSVVVEWEDRTKVPAQLPEQWVAPVLSRYGEPDPTGAAAPAQPAAPAAPPSGRGTA